MILKIFYRPALLALFLVISSCASTEIKVHSQDKINKVNGWNISLISPKDQIERDLFNVRNEVKGTERDVNFLNAIYSDLERTYKVPIQDNISKAKGFIIVDTVYVSAAPIVAGANGIITVYESSSAVLYDVHIKIIDKTGSLLAQIKVENGRGRANHQNDKEFSKYTAEAIYQAIVPK